MIVTGLGIEHFGVFCAAVLLLNLTPGPDTAFIVGQSVARGRGAGLMAVLGISAGCVVHTIAIAFGLSALIAASANAFAVIKWVGAAYLVYLGVRTIAATLGTRAATDARVERDAPAPVRRPASRRVFAQGFVTNVTNPKVVLFFLSLFPQFVGAGSAHKGVAFAVLGAVLVAISTAYNAGVAWIAGTLTRRMQSAPRVKAWLERAVGGLFIALGARIATSER